MELTRRDAVAALAALGVVGAGAGAAALDGRRREPAEGGVDTTVLVAAAEVLYPSEVTGVGEFVERFVTGRARDDGHREGLVTAIATVDNAARDWYGVPYAELDAETRDSVLRELGADVAEPDPDGRRSEQVRYYVVNDLLYALYSSPVGGRLAGIENPIGHPGGTTSYQQGSGEG